LNAIAEFRDALLREGVECLLTNDADTLPAEMELNTLDAAIARGISDADLPSFVSDL
jgi:hypothetical protein